MGAKFVPNERAFVQLVSPGGIVNRGVAKAAGTTRDRSKKIITVAGRVDTGQMRQSIESYQIAQTRDSVTFRVGTRVRHAWWQHQGNRPNGPGGRIYPKRAKFLRFKPKGGGAFIYARSVRPLKPLPFLKIALAKLRPSDFK